MSKVTNPKTNRPIKVGAQTFKDLLNAGYVYNEANNTLSLPDSQPTNHAPILNITTPYIPTIVQTQTTKPQFSPLDPLDTQTKVLLSDFTVKHIIHISDIHIPLNLHDKRLSEYQTVFNNLYSYIKSNIDLTTTIIIVTGDLIHVKIKLEAETIKLARDFLYNLSQLTQTIVIIGNHDFTENNKERTDTLSAIADRLPVHVLKYTGVYQFGNILFAFNSLFDNKFIRYHDIPSCNLPVYALFHGTLVGAESETGRIMNESITKPYPNINDFNGYDAVLLGHIHKQQFIRKNIAYAGSLIQQNFGEQINGHGLLLWDTQTHTAISTDILNPYKHLNIRIASGNIEEDSLKLLNTYSHSKLHIKCHCINTTREQANDVHTLLTKNYNVESFTLSRPPSNTISINQSADNNSYLTLDKEIELITNHITKPELCNHVVELHKKYYTDHVHNSGSWYPTMLTWKNIGIYGNDHANHINFQTGISNICSQNMTGKSTIVNIILFALYHKTANGQKSATDILNKYASKGYIELDFIHNGNHYKIQKHIDRMRRSARDTVGETFKTNFFIIESHGVMKNLNGSTQTHTLTIIKEYVGSLEQFIGGNLISTRSDVASILTKTPTDLIKYFHKICNTEHYDDYIKSCTVDAKDIGKQITKLKSNIEYIKHKLQQTSPELIGINTVDIKAHIDNLQVQYNQLYNDRDSITAAIAIINNPKKLSNLSIDQIESEINKLTQIQFSDSVVDDAANYPNENAVDNNINELYTDIITDLPSINQIEEDLIAIDLELQDMLLNKPENDIDTLNINKGKLEAEMTTIKNNIKKIQEKINELSANSVKNHQLHIPPTFNIINTRQRIDEIKLELRDVTKNLQLTNQNITICEAELQLKQLSDCKSDDDISKLQFTLEQKETELLQFNHECLETTLSEQKLNSQFKEPLIVLQKLDQPHDINEQIANLEEKQTKLLKDDIVAHRDTWYRVYINGNEIHRMPKNLFEKYYNDTNRMEFNIINTRLHHLTNVKNHNQSVDSAYNQNIQIQQHNDNIQKQLNWLKKQHMKQHIVTLSNRIKYLQLNNYICYYKQQQDLNHELNQLNNFVILYYQKQYDKDLESLTNTLHEKEHQFNLISTNINWWTHYRSLIEDKETLINNKKNIDSNAHKLRDIDHLKTVKKYITIGDKIAKLTKDKKSLLESNELVKQKHYLESVNNNLEIIKKQIKDLEQKLTDKTHSEQANSDLENYNHQLLELEQKYAVYDEYKKLFDRKAIPAVILKSKLQLFVDQTNQIFSDCTKYMLKHKITDKDKLEFYIIDNNTNACLEPHRLSGYETLALQIALNKATIDISSANKTSLFIIDESLDCVDQQRFNDVVTKICNIIKQHFTVTLIISHRDIPSDTIDQNINITHANNCSYIQN